MSSTASIGTPSTAFQPSARLGFAPSVRIGGLDVNQATPEELSRRLDGIGPGLARTIVKNRDIYGPFVTVHDLGRVPGVGPSAFTRITGLPWREDAHARREEALEILGASSDRPHAQSVADRFAKVRGFTGCIIADNDGELLAESWPDPLAEAIGAYAPHVLQKLAPMLQAIGRGNLDMMTLFIAEQAYTIVPYKNLVFVAVHEMNRFSRKQLRLTQQVANLLGCSLVGPL